MDVLQTRIIEIVIRRFQQSISVDAPSLENQWSVLNDEQCQLAQRDLLSIRSLGCI